MRYRVFGKKQVIWIVAAAVWAAVLIVVLILSATRAVSAGAKLLPVYSVARDDKKIALTFNCAWGDETTDGVLEILRENGVKATFFFVGTFAQKYPESVKKICNAGHEPGNHSMYHNDPAKQSFTEISSDIEECNALLYSLTGVRPTLYRAPSGAYSNDTVAAAQELGLVSVQWSADSIDWKDPSPDTILRRIEKRVSPGGILLFHLGKQNTLDALPEVLSSLKSQGYEFCTVSELLLPGETYVDANGVQRPAGD